MKKIQPRNINMINVHVIYGIQINGFLMKNKVSSSLFFLEFCKYYQIYTVH